MTGFTGLVVFLPVADLAAAHEFYAGVLRLEMVMDQGSCRIYRVTGPSHIGLCEHLAGDSGGVVTTLVTDDVDLWYERLSAAGVELDHPPRHNERFGIYHFFVADPAGNRLEVQRFDSPRLPV